MVLHPLKTSRLCVKFAPNIFASDCWRRYDHSNTSTIHVSSSQASTFFNEDDEPSILRTPSALRDPLWYLDSGASHHLTHDNDNLIAKMSYSGPDVVKIGNNTGLPIKNVGSAVYTSPCTAHNFFIYNLLHVPSISKNLLSVSRLARDNNVFFEFHSDFCLVKHQEKKEILLQGKIKDEIYAFQNFVPSSDFTAHTASVLPKISSYTSDTIDLDMLMRKLFIK